MQPKTRRKCPTWHTTRYDARAIAEVMTASKLTETQIDGLHQANSRLEGQARQALHLGKDSLAQMALQ